MTELYTPTTDQVRSKYAQEWIDGEYFGDRDAVGAQAIAGVYLVQIRDL